MAPRRNEDVEADLGEVPPLGYLALGIVFAWAFLTIRPMENTYALADFAVAGGGIILSFYIVYRAHQMYQSRGIGSTLDWLITPVEELDDIEASKRSGREGSTENSLTASQEGKGLDLDTLRSIDEDRFEEMVADWQEAKGWDTEVTQSKRDGGIDVIAEKDDAYHRKKLLQAKRYSKGNKVGGPELSKYYYLKDQEEGVDEVVVVTTNEFTRDAKERAKDLNVKTVDGEEFLKEYKKYVGDS